MPVYVRLRSARTAVLTYWFVHYGRRPPTPGSYLVGLIGAGIGGSLSPALHEHEAACLGLALRLPRARHRRARRRAASDVGALLEQAREAGFDGLNVTHPCKQLVLEHLDALTEEAAALGAVNTVVLRDGRAVGGQHGRDRVRRELPARAARTRRSTARC